MSTTVEQINALIDAGNNWKGSVEADRAQHNSQLDAHRAAYEGLAADLDGRFWSQYFVDQLNGDDANPGTRAEPLQTLRRAGDMLPNGTTTKINLIGDYRMDQTEFFDRGTYLITSDDDDNQSVISFAPEIDGENPNAPRFNTNEPFVEFWFDSITMHLEPVSAHVNFPWTFSSKGSVGIYFVRSDITVAAGSDRNLIENNGVVVLSVKTTTFPEEMAGAWLTGVSAGTPATDVSRVLTTLATL